MTTKARAFQHACRARLCSNDVVQRTEAHSALFRTFASQSKIGDSTKTSGSTRRAITVTSDDGRYSWSELSTGEKAARTTQQSFNFLMVAAGALGTAAVSYLLYTELFASNSKTRQFNRAVDRIKADAKCRELLGTSSKIVAYGEPTTSKWARARPLAHSTEVDKLGIEHFRMHFNIEGPEAKGTVNVHMTRRMNQAEQVYQLLSLSVPGHPTVYLENNEARSVKSAGAKMFGVRWN